jgi:hypothetical protein
MGWIDESSQLSVVMMNNEFRFRHVLSSVHKYKQELLAYVSRCYEIRPMIL